MALSREDEQTIQEGLEAEALLGSSLFRNTVKTLNMKFAVEWMETDEGDKELRERLYFQHRGLVEVEGALMALVTSKDSIMAYLKNETADHNESE